MACWRCPADELHIQTAPAECDLLIEKKPVYGLPHFPAGSVCLSQKRTQKTADRDQQRQNSNAERISSYMQKTDTVDEPNGASAVGKGGKGEGG